MSVQTSRRQFLVGSGALAIGFTLAGPATSAAAAAAASNGLVRVEAVGAPANTTQSWLVLTKKGITVYSGKVELGTGVQTALAQMVVEELRLGVADVDWVQGDTLLSVSQGGTTGSKSIQNGGIQLQQAAATAFQELSHRAAAHFKVTPDQLVAQDGRFSLATRSGHSSGHTVTYKDLLKSGVTVLPLDQTVPLMAANKYVVVGTNVPRVDLPAKMDATFRFLHDVTVPGMLHGRVVRPTGRNSTQPVISNLDRAKAIEGFVDVVQHDRFIGVVATSEWAASVAASPKSGISVSWTTGPKMIAQADLPAAVRDPANHYRSVVEIDDGVAPILATADQVLNSQYFSPFHMHGGMGASTAVADVRRAPDPATGIQATIWSGTQNVTALAGAIAPLLGLAPAAVRVIYVEASGCYGHNGADDCAADAAVLSQAVGKPVRVQWTRQDEHAWEPLGGAQAHDMQGAVGPDGIIAWSHLNYAPTANSRPVDGTPGTLLAGTLMGKLPAPLPSSSVDSSGRNAPVTYDFPQRVEARLLKSFVTTGPTSAAPASPLTYLIPRTTALRSLGGFSNSFANESFFDELAHAGGHDPLELRIASLPDPRAVAVCEALRDVWRTRPPGGDGTGAGVAFHQYEVVNAYVATYAEVRVDPDTGKVTVTRVVVAHDCGLIVNPDGLRNQIEGNVVQGVGRTLKEEVFYTDDRVTSVAWQTSSFNPGPQYEVLRFNEVPAIETILINHTDKPPLGAGEPAIGTIGGAIGNAIFAAIGKRIRTLPFTPDRVKAALTG
ncbi:CO or xanthine dehydrogenase, Mo-binding subunit [Streptosporangium subroseum]|uniref:CO or xanthine dehydrogenase, Mo-binding subunit n=1 Tax=Streptosporangium subroseum TaxID=106412 RepID=A0A239P153_9ACTN|nr:molybdopterin cofactor-binding domain-containing protein [Streptosporangium subroseum]SNT60867.1 CO or xanthine dehydrogenase, Mo-binding subunit [Streptosporangium subroseum]